MPAQITAARCTPASPSTSSIIRAEASSASADRWSTSSSRRRSASTLWARSATATCTWLCPKSMPTTARVESWSTSWTPGRPPRWPEALPSTSKTRPETLSSATSVETVVRDRPVERAMSAWLVRPSVRSTPTTRSRLRSRSHASVPSPRLVVVLLATPAGNHRRLGEFVKSDKPPAMSNALHGWRLATAAE